MQICVSLPAAQVCEIDGCLCVWDGHSQESVTFLICSLGLQILVVFKSNQIKRYSWNVLAAFPVIDTWIHPTLSFYYLSTEWASRTQQFLYWTLCSSKTISIVHALSLSLALTHTRVHHITHSCLCVFRRRMKTWWGRTNSRMEPCVMRALPNTRKQRGPSGQCWCKHLIIVLRLSQAFFFQTIWRFPYQRVSLKSAAWECPESC